MDCPLETAVKLEDFADSGCKIEEHFDSGCEEEEDDDNFVLRLSTDESDCEDSPKNQSVVSSAPEKLGDAKSGQVADSSLTVEKNISATTSLPSDSKVRNVRKAKRKINRKSKLINDQKSVFDYFHRIDKTENDGKTDEIKESKPSINDQKAVTDYFLKREKSEVDEVKKDWNLGVIVDAKKLINQLLTARVILERLPDSLLVKNKEINDNQQNDLSSSKKYCPNCEGVFFDAVSRCTRCFSKLIYECSKCAGQYASPSTLRGHMEKCLKGKKRRTYCCHYCYEAFDFKWQQFSHIVICSEQSFEKREAVADYAKNRLWREAKLVVSMSDSIKKKIKRYCADCDKYPEAWTFPALKCSDCHKQLIMSCNTCEIRFPYLGKAIVHVKTTNCIPKLWTDHNKNMDHKNKTVENEKQLVSCKVEGKENLISHVSACHGDVHEENVSNNIQKEPAPIKGTENSAANDFYVKKKPAATRQENVRKRRLSSCDFENGAPVKKSRLSKSRKSIK